jgi:cytochrome c5
MRRASFISVGVLLLLGGSASAQDGRIAYLQNCAVCHNVLDPTIGDKAAWAPFAKMSVDQLAALVIKGGGSMAPRAGRHISDDEIKAAVAYIMSRAK